jgi:hypothetical protein
MRIGIEIDRWEDLVVLKELLNGNGLIKMSENPPQQMGETTEDYVDRSVKAKKEQGGKPATKPAQKPVEEQTTSAGADAPANGSDAATSETGEQAAPLDQSNPFADEVEEEKAPKKPKKLTRDDVNVAFSKYIDIFGQAAAMVDVTRLLQEAFKVSKIKDIPNSQDAFAKAVVLVADAIETNPYERERI